MIPALAMAAAVLAAEPRTAQGVLDAMASTYAHCTSYRDQGTVTIAFESSSGAIATSSSFMTAFVRPDRFRFECAGTNLARSPFRYVFWRDGAATRHWSSRIPGVKTDATFDEGASRAAVAAVSNGVSQFVPSLLVPGAVTTWGLAEMSALTLAQEAISGHDCFKVGGKFGTNERTLWIDKSTHLIRRVEERLLVDRERTVRTVSYDPVVNGKIDDAALAPDVPEGK